MLIVGTIYYNCWSKVWHSQPASISGSIHLPPPPPSPPPPSTPPPVSSPPPPLIPPCLLVATSQGKAKLRNTKQEQSKGEQQHNRMAQTWIMIISELHRYQGVSYKSDITVISGQISQLSQVRYHNYLRSDITVISG